MAVLNAAARARLKPNQFAGPNRTFPDPDRTHAMLALDFAKDAPNPAAVRAKVHRDFPNIGQAVRHTVMQRLGGRK